MSEDRFPEITACKAAQKAVSDFDVARQAKLTAIVGLANMLEKGGWGAAKFREETPVSGQGIRPDLPPISRDALRGEPIEKIVRDRQALMDQWWGAYDAVPELILSSAPAPSEHRS